MAEHLSHTTIDHEEIRKWAEDRGAKPASVKKTGNKSDPGILRLDFPGYSGADSLEHIEWNEFFEKFEESKLALVYQEHTAAGEKSNFNKLISREGAALDTSEKKAPENKATTKATQSKSTKPKTSKAGGKHS